MDQLQAFKNENQMLLDSREVSEMTGKRHDHLLRDIDGYVAVISKSTDPRFGVSDFFIASTYQDKTGRTLRNYLLTRRGCSMVANKMTGDKGVLFTAAYTTKFEEMEQNLLLLATPSYMINDPIKRAQKWIEEYQEKEALQSKALELASDNIKKDQIIKQQEVPVAIYKLAIAAGNTKSMQEVAMTLGTGRTRLFEMLREEGIIMPNDRKPYQKYIEAGYFVVKESPRQSGDSIVTDSVTRVTGKGIDFVARVIKKRNERLAPAR